MDVATAVQVFEVNVDAGFGVFLLGLFFVLLHVLVELAGFRHFLSIEAQILVSDIARVGVQLREQRWGAHRRFSSRHLLQANIQIAVKAYLVLDGFHVCMPVEAQEIWAADLALWYCCTHWKANVGQEVCGQSFHRGGRDLFVVLVNAECWVRI